MKSVLPRVSAVCIGFVKQFILIELECPWCGGEHVVSIPGHLEPPITARVPCGADVVICSYVIGSDSIVSVDDC